MEEYGIYQKGHGVIGSAFSNARDVLGRAQGNKRGLENYFFLRAGTDQTSVALWLENK